MSIIEWKKDGTVAIVKMNNGQNKQNLAFTRAMNQTLDDVIKDDDITAIVITSTDQKCWCAGVDTDWVMERMGSKAFQDVKDFLYGANEVFKKLLLLPVPAIAAINGHAFGNGAIMSCACDFRFMKSDKGFFCFPEVDLGIPFFPGMVAFIQKAFPGYMFNELQLTGRRAAAQELEEHHVIKKASANAEHLMNDALEFAKSFQKRRAIFGEHKKRSHRHIIEIMNNEDPVYFEELRISV